ncbi:MAG TPA: enoyl-CoA hydratase-related protein [Pseudomonadales bacterium]|nr:enoyl-CoA hydratase-related protein [Pseudomonadales bacterium]
MSEAVQDRSQAVVRYDVQDHVALVTLNRPERMNAWNQAIANGLSDALTEAQADDRVRAVVITGAGRAFCAGADLEGGGDTFAGRTDDGSRPPESDSTTTRQNRYPYQIDKPVIAAINGAAVGVGMTYPMLCDQRFVAEQAKLGFVFTRRGMIPELGAHLIVSRVAGFSNAADLLLSGRIFSGAEAASLGIASRALPADEVLTHALARAGEYTLTAPASVAITKRLLWESLDTSLATMMKREGPLFAWVGNQPDAREGILSFVEKRAPQWTGSAAQGLPDDL